MPDNSKLDDLNERLTKIEKLVNKHELEIRDLRAMITPQKKQAVSKGQQRAVGIRPR